MCVVCWVRAWLLVCRYGQRVQFLHQATQQLLCVRLSTPEPSQTFVVEASTKNAPDGATCHRHDSGFPDDTDSDLNSDAGVDDDASFEGDNAQQSSGEPRTDPTVPPPSSCGTPAVAGGKRLRRRTHSIRSHASSIDGTFDDEKVDADGTAGINPSGNGISRMFQLALETNVSDPYLEGSADTWFILESASGTHSNGELVRFSCHVAFVFLIGARFALRLSLCVLCVVNLPLYLSARVWCGVCVSLCAWLVAWMYPSIDRFMSAMTFDSSARVGAGV